MATARFIPEIVDQQNENAASLWLIRDNAVKASSFRLTDLGRLDERVEANIDGLRIAEMSGWSAPLNDLDHGDAGEFFVAGVLAAGSGDPARLDRIIELAYARAAATDVALYHPADNPWRGLVSALAWIDRAHAADAITRLLDTPRPRTRWLGVAACGARRNVRQPGLETALADPEPLVRARAARTMGELGKGDMRAQLNALLADPDDDCRFWAAWSAARLGTEEGLRALAQFTCSTGERCDRAIDLILRRLPVDRANAFLRPLARDPEYRRVVIQATSVIGDALYVPWLIGQMSDPGVARAAGDAFATITSADLSELQCEPPPNFQLGPNDSPEDENVSFVEGEARSLPDAAKVAQWWEAAKERFSVGTAYFLGLPKSTVDWVSVLLDAAQRQRHDASLELAFRQPAQAMFQVRARGQLQSVQLRHAIAVRAGSAR